MPKVTKDKDVQPERFIHPDEAAQAAHHLKMAHHVKNDKHLHKAAKEHLQTEHEALAGALGKKADAGKAKAKGKK